MTEQRIAEDLRERYAMLKNWVDAAEYQSVTSDGSYAFAREIVDLILRVSKAEEQFDAAQTALHQILDWCEAYPLEIFPAPDLEGDRKLLGDVEFTRLNCNSMRHVINGVAKIIKDALPAPPPQEVK